MVFFLATDSAIVADKFKKRLHVDSGDTSTGTTGSNSSSSVNMNSSSRLLYNDGAIVHTFGASSQHMRDSTEFLKTSKVSV